MPFLKPVTQNLEPVQALPTLRIGYIQSMASLAGQMADWLRRQVAAAGSKGIVVGLSGGIDSAVVSRVAQMATDGAVLGVIMPAHSDPQDEADARLVAEHFQLPTRCSTTPSAGSRRCRRPARP